MTNVQKMIYDGGDAGKTAKRHIYGSKNLGSHRGEFGAIDSKDNLYMEDKRMDRLKNANIYMKYYEHDDKGNLNEIQGPIDDGTGNYMLPNSKKFYVKTDQRNLDLEYEIEQATEKRIDELMKYCSLSTSLASKTLGLTKTEFETACKDATVIDTDCTPEKIKLYPPYSEQQNKAIMKLRQICEANMTTLVKSSGTSKQTINNNLPTAPTQ